jgi:hypothetical protein
MTKSKIFLLLLLIGTAPLLSACGTSCDCPKCTGSTTVITPTDHTTVVHPNGDY